MPFMGGIVKCFPASVNKGGAGEIRAHVVTALIFGQYFFYCDSNKFTVFVPELETQGRDLSIRVRAGNHLNGNINA